MKEKPEIDDKFYCRESGIKGVITSIIDKGAYVMYYGSATYKDGRKDDDFWFSVPVAATKNDLVWNPGFNRWEI